SGRTGQALLISGPSGHGKSRMLDLAELHARRLGLPLAVGRCRFQDRPFGAFKSVLQALRGEHLPSVLQGLYEGGDASGERYPVLAAFRDLLVERAPLVLIVDDTDRADPATVELLTYLVRNTLELASEPILFLIGHDTSEQRIRTQLESLASVGAMELPALTSAEVEELVVSVLGSSPAALTLASRVYTEGQGSPAFITDMLRGLIDDGLIVEDQTGCWRLTVDASEITRSQLPMPASLRQVLLERLQPLSPHARSVGRILALARRRVDLDVLVTCCPLPEERLMEGLDELVDAELVTETRSDDDEKVELAHGRFREVLLEGVASEELREGHRRLGEALERHHRGRLPAIVEELAWHFEHAAVPTKAYLYLVLAGERHLQRSLYVECIQSLERALTLEPEARTYLLLDDADRRLAEVWLSLSRARHGLGEPEPAVQAVTQAQRIARMVKDPRLESRIAAELGSQLRQVGKLDEAQAQLRAAIEAAEATGDQNLLPIPLYELGGVLWSGGDLASAELHWRRCLQISQQVGDERSTARGFNGLAILALSRGQQLEARKHLEQAALVFERLGMLSPLVVTRSNLVELYVNTGVLRKAQALAERTYAQAEEVGLLEGIALGRGWRARILLVLGRTDEAERDAREALAAVEKRASLEDEPFVLANLVQLEYARERWQDALLWIERLLAAVAVHDHESVLHEVLGWKAAALAQLGRLQLAAETLDTAPPRPELWPHVQVRTDIAIGRALGMLPGRAEAAREALQRALGVSEANGFRYHQLLAHLALCSVVDPATRDRHARVATGLARSLAANLPADDAQRFLDAHGVRT
ncbi:MAG: AAA family ATPase, partial [Myxococcales bacterium]|nr:AAA family ATPase [Myxococcales bacterium]